jgi:hypothetical protein
MIDHVGGGEWRLIGTLKIIVSYRISGRHTFPLHLGVTQREVFLPSPGKTSPAPRRETNVQHQPLEGNRVQEQA